MSNSSGDNLKSTLRKFFKLDRFQNKLQEDAVKTILKREKDVLISMPTGGGKSLCFQLPGIMQKNKTTIVFSSSSVIKDQMNLLKKSKICAKSMDSKMSKNERERVLKDLTSTKPETRFLYVTADQALSKELKNILESLHKHDKLAYFAVDEAHCISKRSHDYKKDYSKLGSLRSLYPSTPWIVLTAIVSMEVVEDVVETLHLRKPIARFKKPSFRENLYYDVIFKNKILDFENLTQFVTKCLSTVDDNVKDNKKPSGIIYCRTKETVERVANELTQLGVPTRAYHSGLRTQDRAKVQEDWLAGVFPVITATASSAKGVVKPSVRFLVHWDLPASVASYYQESGRAGRDGRKSYCRIYCCKDTMINVNSSLQEDINKSDDFNTPTAVQALADFVKMTGYCEAVVCRHKLFSDYFGDDPPNCRNNCDVCTNPGDVEIALQIFNRVAPSTSNSILRIKDEPMSPPHHSEIVNGQSLKMEQPQTAVQRDMTFESTVGLIRPPRNISPANTIIKEELDNKIELREQLFRPPPAVSPAETLIEEEPLRKLPSNLKIETECRSVSPLNGIQDSRLPNSASDEELDNKIELREQLFRPPPAVSPADTLIDEEPLRKLPSNLKMETECLSVSPLNEIQDSRLPNSASDDELDNNIELREQLFRPPPAVSPAETLIEEEPLRKLPSNLKIETECRSVSPLNEIQDSRLPNSASDEELDNNIELREQLFRPPPAVSPAETLNEEEPLRKLPSNLKIETECRSVSPLNEIQDSRLPNSASDEELDNNIELREQLFRPPPAVSPAETLIEEEPLRKLPSNLKIETECRPVNQLNEIQDSRLPNSASDEISTRDKISHVEQVNPIEPVYSREEINSIGSTTSILPSTLNALSNLKDQQIAAETTSQLNQPNEFNRSLSPTGTIIKDEPATIEENLSNIALNIRMTSTAHIKIEERFHIDERKNGAAAQYPTKNHEDTCSLSSRTPSPHAIKNERNHEPRKRQRSRSPESRSSLSPTGTIIKEEPKSLKVEASSTKSRTKRRRDSSNNSFSSRTSSTKTSSRSYDDNSQRTRTNGHYSKYNRDSDRDYRNEFSSSSPRKRFNQTDSHKFSKKSKSREYDSDYDDKRLHGKGKSQNNSKDQRDRKNGKRKYNRRNSSESETCNELSSDDGHRSPQPSTSRRHRYRSPLPSTSPDQNSSDDRHRSPQSSKSRGRKSPNVRHRSPQPSTSRGRTSNIGNKWSAIRFSMSPVASPSQPKDDSDSDYGWEDPAPPKVKSEVPKRSVLEDLGPDLKEKMMSLKNSLDMTYSQYDLDVIEAEREKLFDAIKESIEVNSKKRLTELDAVIQKKKDDYVRNLFGTDNFESWDDDPALSNVKMAKKLKPFKKFIPKDATLLEKMNLKHVINASRLTPARQRNELVFHGHIKQIETEFQGQELPAHLLDAIKEEKKIIADLVKKILMPYFNEGRIQPKEIFASVARRISHVFYDRKGDETIIKNYIDNIFKKYGMVTNLTNLET